MVSTRSSESLSDDNSKRSSSPPVDKPPSPKRQKVESGGKTSENPPQEPESSKEIRSPSVQAPGDAGIAGDGGKGKASSPVTPIAEGPSPSLVDNQRSCNPNRPWCRLLSQSGLNPNVTISPSTFTIGTNKNCDLVLKSQLLNGVLCKINRTQRESSVVACLCVEPSQIVRVNGIAIKENSDCVLRSGDDVCFSLPGNFAYIFQQLMPEVVAKDAELKCSAGKVSQLERKTGDPSAVEGASILASILSQNLDLSRQKPRAHSTTNVQPTTEIAANSAVQEGTHIEVNRSENNSSASLTDQAAHIGETIKNLHLDCNQDSVSEAGNVLDERNELTTDFRPESTSALSLRCALFRKDIHSGILDGRTLQVSFENFPYYLRRV